MAQTHVRGFVELSKEVVKRLHQLLHPQHGRQRGEVANVRKQDGHVAVLLHKVFANTEEDAVVARPICQVMSTFLLEWRPVLVELVSLQEVPDAVPDFGGDVLGNYAQQEVLLYLE